MLKLGPTYRGVHWMGGMLELLHRYGGCIRMVLIRLQLLGI